MATSAAMAAYLNDHLAGAMMGVDLAKSCHARHQGTPLGDFLGQLVDDIEADREALEELMARLGAERSQVKRATGWVAEKLSRVALAPQVTGSAEASSLLQVEALSLGIEGKHDLWLALQAVAEEDEQLGGADLGVLAERARSQRAGLEQHRTDLAAQCLAPGPAGAGAN